VEDPKKSWALSAAAPSKSVDEHGMEA